ncbi:hypothetical protein RFF58_06225 [Streptococcus ruminantium]|nr:hypothetical protein [Streptococcus ruminantium]
MDELKIREDGIFLNGHKLKTVQSYKLKNIANGRAELFLKISVKVS